MCGVNIMKDHGGHFEIQNGDTKLHDPDCYHTYMLFGNNKLVENMVRLCPSTGNENVVWRMH